MNKPSVKTSIKLQPRLVSSVKLPSNPASKRKPIQEMTHQTVRPKLTSSVTLPSNSQNKIKIQLNKGLSSKFHSSEEKENSKPNKPLPNKVGKNGANPVLAAIERSLNKFGNKPAKIVSTEEDRTRGSKLISKDKVNSQGSSKSKYDELMKAVKSFDSKRRALLTNLNDITNTLEGSQEALFRESAEKLRGLEEALKNHKSRQTEELEKLSAKIKSLKETQHNLTLLLPQKKIENEKLEKEDRDTKNIFMNYSLSVHRNQQLLTELLKKKEDLNSFIDNVEIAIQNTKEKVKSRSADISIEEKRSLILEELLHTKKQNFRTFLFLKGPKFALDSSDPSAFYRIFTHDNKRRIKLDVNQNGMKQSPVFYEFDSIYYLNPFKEREEAIFYEDEQKLYRNILSSILENEQKMSYVFLILSHNSLSFRLFKHILEIILTDHLDLSCPQESSFVQFDNDGKVQCETLCSIQELQENTPEDSSKENYLLTFQAKLKNFTAIRRLTFILTPGYNTQLIDTLKGTIISNKKKNNFLNINHNPCLISQNVFPFLQGIGNSSIAYALLAFENEKRPDPEATTSSHESLESLNLLKILSRIKN